VICKRGFSCSETIMNYFCFRILLTNRPQELGNEIHFIKDIHVPVLGSGMC